ncbi:hypothetical protein OQA88_1537 [Cercophora sp. LCS_1]
MASKSTHTSPSQTAREAVDEKPESPVLPPQHPQAVPVQPVSLEKMESDNSQPNPNRQDSRAQVKTPEPRSSKERINQKDFAERSPSTPGHLAPFDWDDFEARFQLALKEANDQEEELLHEFKDLVEYFGVWAEAASAHDTERAIKRLQTRERYVKIAEQSLSQKKKHLTEVVRAFQSALALLSQS